MHLGKIAKMPFRDENWLLALLFIGLIAIASVGSAIEIDANAKRVKFPAGATGTLIKETVNGYQTCDFLLGAREGQTMEVSLETDNPSVYFAVFRMEAGEAQEMDVNDQTSWSGVLPKNGDYVVRVYLFKAEAQRNGKAGFNLRLSITAAKKSDTPTASASAEPEKPTPAIRRR